MYSGELGPSTIVGSAAFNLLMILAICVVAVPEPQLRRIDSLGVYTCTATGSVLAYVWLVFILQVSSPDIITPLEGVATFGAFFVLVALAYLLDIGFFSAAAAKKREKELMQNAQVLEVTGDGEEGERQPHPALVARAIREVQGVFDETAADSDAFKEAVKAKIAELQPRSRAYGGHAARTLGAASTPTRAPPHVSPSPLLLPAAQVLPGQRLEGAAPRRDRRRRRARRRQLRAPRARRVRTARRGRADGQRRRVDGARAVWRRRLRGEGERGRRRDSGDALGQLRLAVLGEVRDGRRHGEGRRQVHGGVGPGALRRPRDAKEDRCADRRQ